MGSKWLVGAVAMSCGSVYLPELTLGSLANLGRLAYFTELVRLALLGLFGQVDFFGLAWFSELVGSDLPTVT